MNALRFTWVPLVALMVVVGGLSLALVLGSLPSAQVPAAKTAWRPAADLAGPRRATIAPTYETAWSHGRSDSETNADGGLESPPEALSSLAPAAGRESAPPVSDAAPPGTLEPEAAPESRGFEAGLAGFRVAEMADSGLPPRRADKMQTTAPSAPVDDSGEGAVEPLSLAGYVVIGSFRTQARAAALVARHGQWRPSIQLIDVEGVAYHRVVVGPFDPSELDSAWQAIKAAGLVESWRLTVKPRGGTRLFARRLDIPS